MISHDYCEVVKEKVVAEEGILNIKKMNKKLDEKSKTIRLARRNWTPVAKS